MPASTPVIREMSADDATRVWEIRNHETVRTLSKTSEQIPLPQHLEWFARYLKRTDKVANVLLENGTVVGYCRIDAGLVSIAIDPTTHGRGYGQQLLQSTIVSAGKRWGKITAEVLQSNIASQLFFSKQGFRLVSQHDDTLLYEFSHT